MTEKEYGITVEYDELEQRHKDILIRLSMESEREYKKLFKDEES